MSHHPATPARRIFHAAPAAPLVTLFIAVVAAALPPRAEAHKEYVHQYLAIEAYRLLLDRHPFLAGSPFAGHVGTQSGDCAGFPFTAATIAAGAYREDCEDPVFGYGNVAGPMDEAYFSASHFWDADAGDNSTIRICDLTCGDYQNSFRKTLRYVLPALYGRWTAKLTWPAGVARFHLPDGGTGAIAHGGMIGFDYDSLAPFYRDGSAVITGYLDVSGRWQTPSTVPDQLPLRIVAPQGVRDRIAWEVIGRIVHLLGDMGVPAHAHNDIHPPFWWGGESADVFESEMGSRYGAWGWEEAATQGHLLELPGALPGAPAENALRYFLYCTNQVADRFPSNDADGDSRYDRSWGTDDYSVLDIIGEAVTPHGARGVFHAEAADMAFVFSIRAIAGLYRWFALETGILARVTADADHQGVVLTVDGKPRNAPHSFVALPGTAFTLQAADQPGEGPATGGGGSLVFVAWERNIPGEGVQRSTDRLLSETAVPGASYRALFERRIPFSLETPRQMDGGTGGFYVVDGAQVGNSWSSALAEGSTISLGCVPPPGSVFLEWSDGTRANPRTLSAGERPSLRALLKRRFVSSPLSPPALPGQRRIARGATASSAILVYESAGDIYYCESGDGIAWSDEELVSDGLGNARNPSVAFRPEQVEGDHGALVAWSDLPDDGEGYRILLRSKAAGRWEGIRTLHEDPSRRPDPVGPVVSGAFAAWKGADGILVRGLDLAAAALVPGTDPSSGVPLLDAWSSDGRAFAIAWTQPGTGFLLRGGTGPGYAWSPSVTILSASGMAGLREPDIVLNDAGAGCAAWALPAAGGWRVEYRTFDPAGTLSPIRSLAGCPFPETAPPSPRLSHHRLDAGALRDFSLHVRRPGLRSLLFLTLRSGARIGPSIAAVPGELPQTPSALSSPSSGVPILTVAAAGDGSFLLQTARVPLIPSTPRAPALLTPADGHAAAPSSLELRWDCAGDADLHETQVSPSPSFPAPLAASPATAAAQVPVAGLQPGTTYHWRVRGVNPAGAGPWSAARSFTTGASPGAPALSGSIVTAGTARHPRLSWTAPAGAGVFRLSRYVCQEAEECARASLNAAIVYEGTATAWTDGGIVVGTKSAASRAWYRVTAGRDGFFSAPSNEVSFGVEGDMAWAAPQDPLPSASGLGECYPNPFNAATRIPYRIAERSAVSLSVHNLLGQRVALLADGRVEPGFHEAEWDAGAFPAGVYVVALDAAGEAGGRVVRDRRKIILLK